MACRRWIRKDRDTRGYPQRVPVDHRFKILKLAAPSSGWMRRMFDSVPREYALSNRILTFGQDNRWRNRVLEAINPLPNAAILDICTGPADLALKIAASFSGSRVYACDFSPRMLEHAGERAGVRRLHI